VIKELNEIEVITLFVEDLPATKAFYTDVFGLEVIYQDDVAPTPRTVSRSAVSGGESAGAAVGGYDDRGGACRLPRPGA